MGCAEELAYIRGTMTVMQNIDLSDLPSKLLKTGLLSQGGYERFERLSEKSDGNALALLVSKGLVGEEDLYRFIAEMAGLPYKVLDPLELDYDAVTSSLPGAFAQRYHLVAFSSDDGVLDIATSNLEDTGCFDDIVQMLDMDVRIHVSRPSEIAKVIRQFYGLHSSIVAAAKEMGLDERVDLGNLERFVSSETARSIEPTDRPVVNAVNHLLQYAFEEHASDIHLEPHREGTHVRLRIDGILHTIYNLPKKLHLPIVSRIKMVAGMNIAEKRKPQDGRIRTHFEGKPVEIRCSSVPVAFGEKAVLRILDPSILMQDMSHLGFTDIDADRYSELISHPHGLVLVTGPTGSGKTTTLYSSLTTLATSEKNITTIEEPIEFITDEFNQIGVQPSVGVTFITALRHILRQDPDIIMVGEIRDEETAKSAIRCALTGHLVLSTLHTNDSASTIARLLDMGIEPYILSNTLLGVVAQRLVRRVCTECSEQYEPTPEMMKAIGLPPERRTFLRRGKGCRACRNTGYKGRVAVFEVMGIDEEVRSGIARSASIDEIKDLARKSGMAFLRENALSVVLAGTTTPEEMLGITIGGE
jgi:general secretion pathway protein E